MRKHTVLLLLLFLPLALSAQKALKPLRALIKNKNGNDAAAMVIQLCADSALRNEPRLYELGRQAAILVNNVENEKIYLHQSYDTLRFFSSTYDIIDYALRLDSLESALQQHTKRKPAYRKESRALLRQHHRNLAAGGRYLYATRRYAQSLRYMQMYLDAPCAPLWGDDASLLLTAPYAEMAFLHQKSAFLAGQYALVPRYASINLCDTTLRRAQSLEFLALSAQALGDTASYTAYLRTGLADYPQRPFFFSRLTEDYGRAGDHQSVLRLAAESLARDSINILALEAQNLAQLSLARYADAAETARRMLHIDSTLVEPNYYLSAALCNLATEVTMPVSINSRAYKRANAQRSAFYQEALPYAERYREKRPEAEAKWAPLLYKIYLHLNRGKQFDEISEILRRHQ